jgi:hypothetical protein
VLETAGSYAAGGTPSDLILGPPGASGLYDNANASVVNGHFSPYVDGTATFVVLDSMVTAMTTFTSVDFHFGTTPDTILVGHPVNSGPVDAPEPASLAIVTTAVLAFPLARQRRRMQPVGGVPINRVAGGHRNDRPTMNETYGIVLWSSSERVTAN